MRELQRRLLVLQVEMTEFGRSYSTDTILAKQKEIDEIQKQIQMIIAFGL